MPESPLVDVQLRVIESIDDAMDMKRWLGERHDGPVCIDTESGGLSPERDRLRMVQVGDKKHGWAIPCPDWAGAAKEIINSYEGQWSAHNGVYDWRVIKNHLGIELPWHRLDDTLTMARIDNPARSNGLKPLSSKLVCRTAVAGEKSLREGMQANRWTWNTVPHTYPPYWCVPKTTEILTRRGWLTWDQIHIGADETLGYVDGKNVWTLITQVYTPGIAETVRLGSKHWGTICTPDHRWVMRKGKAQKVVTIPLVDGWRDESTTKLILSAPAEGGQSQLTPDEAAVLAWILSDGHITWGRPKTWTSPNAQIVQKPGIYADKIRDLLLRTGAYVSERVVKPSQCLSFYVSAPYVTKLWADAGLRESTFIDLVMRLTAEARAAWCQAWLDAEGTKGRLIVSQKDGPKAEALALTLYMEGYAVDIQRTQMGVHSFHYVKRWPTPQKTRITPNGPVDVWCPTTENGTWTARDVTGNIFLTGNCYSALDPVLTAHLDGVLRPRVAHTEAYSLERAANRICAKMMDKGMLVDVPYTQAAISSFQEKVTEIRAWLESTHGITSPKSGGQIRRALEANGVEVKFWTDSGAPQFDKKAMSYYEAFASSPAVRQLMKYLRAVRHIEDISGRYLGAFLELRDANDVVHCNINVMGARTSRMSVSDPPLQQLPRDDKMIRGSIIPRPGYVFITCDLDQVEMRILAHLSEDPGLIQAFLDVDSGGGDFFNAVASVLYHTEITDKKDPRRQLTKNSSYARAYGSGSAGLAVTAGVSIEEIVDFEKMFDSRFPGMATRMDLLESQAKAAFRRGETGGVTLASGRFLPCDQGKEYACLNYEIQSTAAEYMKRCLVNLDAAGFGDMLCLPVHDEVIVEVPAGDAERLLPLVEQCMTDRDNYLVPITAGGSILPERWMKT